MKQPRLPDGVPAAHRDDLAYLMDNIHLKSVGIDVGSSTMQVMFSAIHLHREALALSTRYEVQSREMLAQSAVELTPYLGDGFIDAEQVGQFVRGEYGRAGLDPDMVDTGAILLTGEALRQRNARAVADSLAGLAGDFVCVSAGHNLEALLAAHGSGAVDLSAQGRRAVLCVDAGGGTTKLALVRNGRVAATGAIEVGGRIVAWDAARRLTRVTATVDRLLGAESRLRVGEIISEQAERELARRIAGQILAVASGRLTELNPELVLTEGLEMVTPAVEVITFSGGVAEYVFGRETRQFGDLGPAIGAELRRAIAEQRLPAEVADPGQGIRATVAGVSQCTVQVSGSTVAVADVSLPLRNVPVVDPVLDLSGAIAHETVAAAISGAVRARDLPADAAVAVALRWEGPPSYGRLAELARGLDEAWAGAPRAPLIVIIDRDLAASVGAILSEELSAYRGLVCLDNVQLSPFDYVDVGPPIWPAGVFPVVIKSLLFGSAAAGRPAELSSYRAGRSS